MTNLSEISVRNQSPFPNSFLENSYNTKITNLIIYRFKNYSIILDAGMKVA
jgi:hypothetical protein